MVTVPKEGGLGPCVVWGVCGGEVPIGLERLGSLLDGNVDIVELCNGG